MFLLVCVLVRVYLYEGFREQFDKIKVSVSLVKNFRQSLLVIYVST